MAVAFEMRFTGATLDQYDVVMEKMGLESAEGAPPGALFHWVAETDDGIKVVDVWESAAEFEQFSREQIEPFTREAGFEGPPEVTTYEVHNYLSA